MRLAARIGLVVGTLALLALLSSSSQAFKRPPADPQGRTFPDKVTETIRRAEDAHRILGEMATERDPGKPIADAKTLAAIGEVHTDPGDLPQLKVEVEGKKLDLPLKHTHVKAEITGHVARVEVTQTYQNPFAYPIEAVYVFPLPENSAVDDMRMVIGERVIEAEIKKREEARRTYEEAKAQGHTSALLEQERPNIFTQSVANIEPGTDIDVVIRYLQTLTYDEGQYEFVFPMVVGPRFIPGNDKGSRSGTGWGKDTDQVPDGSRISPPVVGAGMRSGHDISLELLADAGLPIKGWEVPTHEMQELPMRDGSLALLLAEKESLPNRDFVLRYRVDGREAQATLLSHRGKLGGYATLIVQPPKLDVDKLVGQRELIFVVDVSGSMHGVPLAMCQDAMEEALKGLRPVDTFNIITFAGATGKAFEASRPANDMNIKDGLKFVRSMTAGGGTYMMDGVKAALDTSIELGRHRYVFFLTDGYVGNEGEILAGTQKLITAIERQGQRAKVFGFGVGSSVNRHLLDGLSKAGKGLTFYSTTREDPTLAVNAFYRLIDHPVLSNVQIDWGGLSVEQVFPTVLPDLFATRPLIVHARYSAAGSGTIKVRGEAQGRKIELPLQIELPDRQEDHAALPTLWARAKIDWLERDLWNGQASQAVEAITELGISYRIVTAYTSFVAVDRSKKVGDGKPTLMVQPVESPEGVDARMAGAQAYANKSAYAPVPLMMRAPAEAEAAPMGLGGGGMGTRGRGVLGGAMPGRSKGKAGGIAHDAPAQRTLAETSAVEDKRDAQLAPADIEAVVRSHHSELKACYDKAAQSRPNLAGKLTLRWFVTAQGLAIQLKVKQTTVPDELAQCVLAAVKRWTFPASSGSPRQVVYTFTLPL